METLPLPDGFMEQMSSLLGPEWPQLRDALAHRAERAVRLHRVWAEHAASCAIDEPESDTPWTRGVWAVTHPPLPAPAALRAELRDPVPWLSGAHYIDPDSPLGRTVYHESGAYYIQEPSAMAAVAALDPRPGERVLDLCAAPGGKTTAIGRALAGTGTLVANEIHRERVVTLAQNLERTGVPAVVVNESPERLAQAWPAWFDAVLVDAPCSGEGMFRKDPEARRQWSPAAPARCAELQRHIMLHATQMVRTGGRIVYSTCTLNPVENEQVVAWALEHLPLELEPLPEWPGWSPGRPDWAGGCAALAYTRRLWPHIGRGEGHFIARFRVMGQPAGSVASGRRSPGRRSSPARPISPGTAPWQEWISDDRLSEADREALRRVVTTGEVVFAPPVDPPPLAGLRVLRPGLPIAVVQRGRWVPHHALAMALAPGAAQQAWDLTPEQARTYLAGQALPGTGRRGWVWLHVGGLPIGWGRDVGDRVNNLYPKGLRRSDLIPDPGGM